MYNFGLLLTGQIKITEKRNDKIYSSERLVGRGLGIEIMQSLGQFRRLLYLVRPINTRAKRFNVNIGGINGSMEVFSRRR